jgi:hypothetical protein
VSDISIDTLYDYYVDKFDYNKDEAIETVHLAEAKVDRQYAKVKSHVNTSFIMTESMLLTYIKQLRRGCAAGIDGIYAEHLVWSKDTLVMSTLCNLLTLCVRFGLVGETFTKGLLIPILKKPNIDPTIAKHYRPIVISTTFSKILEIHLLSMCGEHEFHDLQFGFIGSRGTSMAVAMTTGVIDHCVSKGSPVYVCALDAEGAFDGIPHSVMFEKAIDVIPMLYWRLLIYWYSNLVVCIRWGNDMSQPILIRKGTRQGGLSSPFIFNLLYQDLMDELSSMQCGISIDNTSYNMCCYADDILLCSLTISGLQQLIDTSDRYISQHGLRFNPLKTTCVTFGKSQFVNRCWHLQNTPLCEMTQVKHLGVILSNDKRSHGESRIQGARRAYYALQSAGLCVNGCSPETVSHIYHTAVQPVLSYGLECIYQDRGTLQKIETTQNKFLKSALGIKSYCKISPLLKALKLDRISTIVEIKKMSLFKSMFHSNSRSHILCKYLLKCHLEGSLSSHNNLVSSVMHICDKYGLNFAQYLCSSHQDFKHKIKYNDPCGIADSVRYCLFTLHDVNTVNNLLSPF